MTWCSFASVVAAISGRAGDHAATGGSVTNVSSSIRGHAFQGHVASALDGRFIILLGQDCTEEAADSLLVGEDPDDVAAPIDLASESCERVGHGQGAGSSKWLFLATKTRVCRAPARATVDPT